MKKQIYCSILIAACFLLLSSCGMAKGKGEAEKVAESLFNTRIQNGWSGTHKYYSEIFWKNTSEKKWTSIQKLVTKAMGELTDYSLASWNVKSNVNTNDTSGTFVVLVYKTSYENGEGTETLTLFKPLGGDQFSIIGHSFNSKLIQKLIDQGIEQVASGNGAAQ